MKIFERMLSAWLNSSQGSQVGVGMKTNVKRNETPSQGTGTVTERSRSSLQSKITLKTCILPYTYHRPCDVLELHQTYLLESDEIF